MGTNWFLVFGVGWWGGGGECNGVVRKIGGGIGYRQLGGQVDLICDGFQDLCRN